MNSDASTRLKTSKSRIPVPVKNKESSSVNNREKKNSKQAPKVQTLNSYKTAKPCLLQKELPKESISQPVKSDKCINDIITKSSKFKGKIQSSTKTNIKSNCSKEKELTIRTNVRSQGKDILLKSKERPDGNKGKDMSLFKSNLKFIDNERGKLSKLKSSLKSAQDSIANLPTPKAMFEKENQSPNMDWFTVQKDIKFEANEIYRNMILRERELSPSVCNLLPGLRLSSIVSQRPSAYQKFEVSRDPFKEAKLALENASLSVKREQKSAVKHHKRPSSPFINRGSFYTPCADPAMKVMESLQKCKLKQLQNSVSKSTKKVTFDLNIKECTPQNTCDIELKSFKKSDNRLTQINEKSEENTPNSPQNERVEDSSSKQNKGNTDILTSGVNKNDKISLNDLEVKAAVNDTRVSTCGTVCKNPKFCTPATKPILTTVDVNLEKISSAQCEELGFHSLKETHSTVNVSQNFECDNVQTLDETTAKHQRQTECQTLDKEFKRMVHKNLNPENTKIIQAKVYTPRPFSFYSKCNLMNSSSPEFLEKGASEALLKSAPICTPLVLRSVAKSTALSPEIDLSPVRLKLDFTEKETPGNKTSKKSAVVTLGNIATFKNKLDELADEECCLWLLNETVPVVCGRYLTDPVALTLTEGDEMHFIPIQF